MNLLFRRRSFLKKLFLTSGASTCGSFFLDKSSNLLQLFRDIETDSAVAYSNNLLTFWINAFIPKDIAGLTKPVPGKGIHRGKTMIPGPLPKISDCFLTDQRSFSGDRKASSRMHSEITINLTTGLPINQAHRCDATIEVDCEDGQEECRNSASTGNMIFSNVKKTPIPEDIGFQTEIALSGAANNACFKGSPNINYTGTVSILQTSTEQGKPIVSIGLEGFIEPFPAFEIYAALGQSMGIPIFTCPPEAGKTPRNLFGNANKPVDCYLTIDLNTGRKIEEYSGQG
jgi:hypothetical protein